MGWCAPTYSRNRLVVQVLRIVGVREQKSVFGEQPRILDQER